MQNSDYTLAVFFGLACFFFSAYLFGRLEKFTFGDCELHVGAPNFLKYFVRGYHVPMAAVFLVMALSYDILILNSFERFFGVVLFFPTWAWIEDMSYFVDNPFDRLDAKDWVVGGLGGVTIAGQFIPFVYVAFFIYTALIVWLRLL
jgi:hypothetical protein